MIVELSATRPPEVTDADRLDRLSATIDGPLESVRLDPSCRLADAEHVWVSIDALRTAATAHADPGDFEAMIAYASSKGWVDEEGTHVRAHIEAASSS